MKYVAVDIGCIECGEQSSVLGIFTDRKKAEDILKKCEKYQKSHWIGQHEFAIFDVKIENELIDNYYKEKLKGENND